MVCSQQHVPLHHSFICNGAQIWDLESKSIVDELRLPAEALPSNPGRKGRALAPFCVSLCWSIDGATLFSGYTDGVVRVWSVGRAV